MCFCLFFLQDTWKATPQGEDKSADVSRDYPILSRPSPSCNRQYSNHFLSKLVAKTFKRTLEAFLLKRIFATDIVKMCDVSVRSRKVNDYNP